MASKVEQVTKKQEFKTLSGITLKPAYTPEDLKELDEERDLGSPGQYPILGGVIP